MSACDDNKFSCCSGLFRPQAFFAGSADWPDYFFWQPFMHMSYSVLQVFAA